ncbi:hypothetical protein BH20ACT7_BH20ACT7_12970 [soil metagenome]
MRGRRHDARGCTRMAWLASAVIASALTACTPAAPDSEQGTRQTEFPRRVGEPVQVAEGGRGDNAWTVVAQKSQLGTCLELRDDATETVSCGFEVPRNHDVGFVTHDRRDGSAWVVAGVAASDVAVLEVQLAGGERVRVDPQPPSDGFRTVFFAAQLPDSARVDAVIATDGDGRRLERRSAVSRQAGG